MRVEELLGNGRVNIALQTEDHGRLLGSFPILTSLWEILLHFEQTQ